MESVRSGIFQKGAHLQRSAGCSAMTVVPGMAPKTRSRAVQQHNSWTPMLVDVLLRQMYILVSTIKPQSEQASAGMPPGCNIVYVRYCCRGKLRADCVP